MASNHIINNDALYQYVLDISSRETDDLKQLPTAAQAIGAPPMNVDPDAGQFLYFLIKLIQAKTVLEIGTFTGYSTLWMAKALADDGHITACDIGKEWTDIGKKAWEEAGVAHKIKLILQPAEETLKQLDGQRFDLIFIDADKLNYQLYFEQSLKLLSPNGIIIIDNVLSFGPTLVHERETPGAKAVDDFNRQLLNDNRIDISTLTVGDGMTLVKKKLS